MTQLATAPRAAADDRSIRTFQVTVPEEQLADLRRRLAATRWPDQETVNDHSQGVSLAALKELVQYWQTSYDWRKAEKQLNALPQFVTTIDGVNIHFIHVKSRHPNALPLIVTHGWPGSVFEQIKLIGPLTDPASYGGKNLLGASRARPYKFRLAEDERDLGPGGNHRVSPGGLPCTRDVGQTRLPQFDLFP